MRVRVLHVQGPICHEEGVQETDTWAMFLDHMASRFPHCDHITWIWFHRGKRVSPTDPSTVTLHDLGVRPHSSLAVLDQNRKLTRCPSVSKVVATTPTSASSSASSSSPPSSSSSSTLASPSNNNAVVLTVVDNGDSDDVLRLCLRGYGPAACRSALFVADGDMTIASQYLQDHEQASGRLSVACSTWKQTGRCQYAAACRYLHHLDPIHAMQALTVPMQPLMDVAVEPVADNNNDLSDEEEEGQDEVEQEEGEGEAEEEEEEVAVPAHVVSNPPVAEENVNERLVQFSSQLQLMCDMGYTRHHAEQALLNHDFDADAALSFLMQHADLQEQSDDEDSY